MHNVKKQLLCTSALIAVSLSIMPSPASSAGSFICKGTGTAAGGGSGGSTASTTGSADNVACGTGNRVNGSPAGGGSAIGVNNTTGGDFATAVGWNNKADSSGVAGESHGATAIGDTNSATGNRSTAIGNHQFATGNFSTAVGSRNNWSAGDVAIRNGNYSSALGSYNQSGGDYSTAIGYRSNSAGASSVAIGNTASASQTNALAIGTDAVASLANSVALGYNARTSAALTGSYSINGGAIAGVGAHPNVVSVGRSGQESVIQNVHAGVVSAASTEAVNGSQLFALGTAVNNGLNGASSALGGGAGWNSATGTWTAPAFTLSNGSSYSTVQAALAHIPTSNPYYQANSSGPAASATGANALAMGQNARATTAGSVAIGQNSVAGAPNLGAYNYYTGDSTNIQAPTTNATQVVSIGSVGNERQLQNLAAGVVSRTSTDAVNGSQLFAMGEGVNALGNTAASILGGGTTYTPGSGLSGTNYAVQGSNFNNVGDALGALNNAVSTSNANYNDLNLNGTKYYKSNSNGSAAQANGSDSLSMGAGSVAGSQNSVAMGTAASATGVGGMALGAGASVTSDGGVAIGSGSVAGGPHIGRYSINGGDVAGATTASTQVVSFGTDAAPRQLQNVATGVVNATSTDAVNGSQLYAVGAATNAAANGAANGLGGGAAWDAANGVWTGPTYNVNGVTHNNVGDALGAVNTNTNTLGSTTAAALGGGSTYTPGQGVSAPNYALSSGNYNNVGDALHSLDGGINNLQGQVNNLTAGVLGNSMSIGALSRGVQRGYEGTAVALATAGGNFLGERQKYSLTGKFGAFRGQYGFGMVAQARVSENVIAHAGVGGGVKYGGVGAFGGLTVGW